MDRAIAPAKPLAVVITLQECLFVGSRCFLNCRKTTEVVALAVDADAGSITSITHPLHSSHPELVVFM